MQCFRQLLCVNVNKQRRRIFSVSHIADMRQHGQLRSHVSQNPRPHTINAISDQHAIRQNIEHAVFERFEFIQIRFSIAAITVRAIFSESNMRRLWKAQPTLFERTHITLFRVSTIAQSIKKRVLHRLSKIFFSAPHYQISSHEIGDNITKTPYINDEIKKTSFNEFAVASIREILNTLFQNIEILI